MKRHRVSRRQAACALARIARTLCAPPKVYSGTHPISRALVPEPRNFDSSMFNPRCVFCGHGNPAGAKFCNECASPLHLKPCNECDAINDRSADSCYKCGADFPMERATIEKAPKFAADLGPATVSGFERERQRLHRPAGDPGDT